MKDSSNPRVDYTNPENKSKLRVLFILVAVSAIAIMVIVAMGDKLASDVSEILPASESNKKVMVEIAQDVEALPSGRQKSEAQKFIAEALSDDKVTKQEIHKANELKERIGKSNTIDISKARDKIEPKE